MKGPGFIIGTFSVERFLKPHPLAWPPSWSQPSRHVRPSRTSGLRRVRDASSGLENLQGETPMKVRRLLPVHPTGTFSFRASGWWFDRMPSPHVRPSISAAERRKPAPSLAEKVVLWFAERDKEGAARRFLRKMQDRAHKLG